MPAARAATPVSARPPPPLVGMQPMNGWKLDRSGPDARAHGAEDDAAARRDARADGAPRLAAERDVDVAGRHAGVGPGDDVPGERAGELVVDAARGHDDPRACDREADPEAVALVGGERGPGRERAERQPADARATRATTPPHSGLRVQASERPEATRRSTTPTPANAAVTSRSSRLVPSRLPRSR